MAFHKQIVVARCPFFPRHGRGKKGGARLPTIYRHPFISAHLALAQSVKQLARALPIPIIEIFYLLSFFSMIFLFLSPLSFIAE
jgi:hypothetical protein